MNDLHDITVLRLIAAILQVVAISSIGFCTMVCATKWTTKPKEGWNKLSKIGAALVWLVLLASYGYALYGMIEVFPDLAEATPTRVYKG